MNPDDYIHALRQQGHSPQFLHYNMEFYYSMAVGTLDLRDFLELGMVECPQSDIILVFLANDTKTRVL